MTAAEAEAEAAGEVADSATYVPAFDGLRAFAVLAVWLLHMNGSRFPGGAVGVEVFFVLSGFLITGILLRTAAGGERDLPGFYWRRACRLFPALLLCVVLLGIPATLASHQGSTLPWGGSGALLYMNDFLEAWTRKVPSALDQTWSLAVEEQYYLIWPTLLLFGVWKLDARRRQAAFLALTVVALVSLFVSGGVAYFLPTGHLLALVVGSWAGAICAQAVPRNAPRMPTLPALAAALILFGFVFVTFSSQFGAHVRIVIVDLATVVLILHLAEDRTSVAARFLGSRVPVWFGARSYGVYLYGLTLITLVGSVTHLSLRYAVFVDAFVTVAIVAASYRFVESPIRRRGRQWLVSRSRTAGSTRSGELATQAAQHP